MDYDTESGGSLFPNDATAVDTRPLPDACGGGAFLLPWLRRSETPNDARWAVSHLADDSESALAIVADTRDRDAIAATRAFAAKPSAAREQAVFVLGTVKDPGAIPVLVDALEADDPRVRSAAAWSLGRIGQVAATADTPLWNHAVGDPSFGVRCAAANTLTIIRGTRVDPVWRRSSGELFAIGTPLPEGLAAEVSRRFRTSIVLEDGDDVLLGINDGEFGGAVGYLPRAHTDEVPTAIDGAPGDPIQFVRVAGEPWLISGLAHLSLERAAVHRIRREASGHLVAERIVSLHHVPVWYAVDDTTLILKTGDGRIHRIQAAY